MIASRRHGFIFIKTRKTAGTSIELALSPHCGPDDVLAPISVHHDLERMKVGILPRWFGRPDVESRYVAALRAGDRKSMKTAAAENRLSGCPAHARAGQVRALMGEAFWASAFKFASERHPYEKVVSLAWHTFRGGDFAAHLDTVVHRQAWRYIGHAHYTIDGVVVADDFVRHETIDADMARIAARLDLPPIVLPRARYSERDRTPARDVLTDRQKTVIREHCALEFDLFGWAC